MSKGLVLRFEVTRIERRLDIIAIAKRVRAGELQAGYSGYGQAYRFAASYIQVAARHRRRGVGEALLRKLAEVAPTDMERLYFFQVTSVGMLLLIERVFGTVTPDGPTSRGEILDRLPPEMDARTLRHSRGFNVWVRNPRWDPSTATAAPT